MRHLRRHNKLTCILSLCLAKRFFFLEKKVKSNVKMGKKGNIYCTNSLLSALFPFTAGPAQYKNAAILTL